MTSKAKKKPVAKTAKKTVIRKTGVAPKIVVRKGKPPSRRVSFRQAINDLKPNEYFVVDLEFWNSLRNASTAANKRFPDRKYSVHRVKDDPTKVGIWRTE